MRLGAIILTALAVHTAAAQTRRALLIGIDTYRVDAASAAPTRGPMPDLDGAVSDARAMQQMLHQRFGFTTRLLENREATREGILGAIVDLIDASRSGDVVFFYYAGHGSQRLNSLAPARVSINHMDQTIVPADAGSGAFDIRNVELTQLFAELLAKNVHLTLIFDSCHSGSAVRGEPLPVKRRFAPFDMRDARDPSDPEPLTSRSRANPALFLAAAQEDQAAEETPERDPIDGAFHGAFTGALLEVLRSPTTAPNEPAEQTFKRVQAIMRWQGRAQVPVLKGTENDHRRSLFGPTNGTSSGRVTLALQGMSGDTAILDGGLALGIGAGSELHATDDGAVRLRIAELPGVATSRAVAIAGSITSVARGTLFVVDRWVSPIAGGMRAWIPNALPAAELAVAMTGFSSLRESAAVDWTDDPTELPDDGRPLYVVEHGQAAWALRTPAGEPVSLPEPTAAAVLSAMSSRAQRGICLSPCLRKPRVFVLFPPSVELRSAMSFPFRVTSRSDSADYALFGQLRGGELRYAWVLPNATTHSQRRSPLPARSDWLGAAEPLQNSGLLLSRIFYWLTVQPHDTGSFPYRLALRGGAGSRAKTEGDTTPNYGGERYSLVLRRAPNDRRPVQPRWVYVFAIDSRGRGTLLFGQSQNHFPFSDSLGRAAAPAEVRLPTRSFGICPPYGVDTFIMVTTPTELAAPASIFNFDPVVTRERGTQPDGGKLPPTDWSIERIALRSEPPPARARALVAAARQCN